MRRLSFASYVALGLLSCSVAAFASSPSSYLVGPNLAVPFDWQKEWGTIHINSYADGLNDPGIPSSSDGVVPCPAGANQCSDFNSGGVTGGAVVHGIKYDIKNSVANCMAVQVPTCAITNGGCPVSDPPYNRSASNPFSSTVCSSAGLSILGDAYSLVYLPFYDSRSLDARYLAGDGVAGTQQLVTNNCQRDNYGVDPASPGYGAYSPVEHVFSSTEKSKWVLADGSKGLAAGAQLPSNYYYYQLKSDNSWVFSSVSPSAGTYVAGTLKSVDNYSNDLAAIQAYRVNDTADTDGFVLVDPSSFFDLRKYSYSGSPEPYANCPVLGLQMYDGICDPTGYAGCNLPLYGVGPTTTFTGTDGSKFDYNNYPIMWSGYALAWSFISTDQYWNKVKNRKNIDGARIYASPRNSNPVLMLVRAPSYCTNEEMTTDPTSGTTDLPCLQYLQYETQGGTPLSGQFVDLYAPQEDVGTKDNAVAYVIKHDYNVTGDNVLGAPVLNTSGKPITFFDNAVEYLRDGASSLAVVPMSPVVNSAGEPSPGALHGSGSGIKFEYGTSMAIQFNNQTVRWADQDVNCLEFVNAPNSTGTGKTVFVPTNTIPEFQSFADAVYSGMNQTTGVGNLGGNNITGGPCNAKFKLYSSGSSGSNPNGTQSWYGTTSCSQIEAPSCNQVTTISAQRYCLRPTGLYGDCGECGGDDDPDALLSPGPNGVISDYHVTSGAHGTNTCYFQAYCHSVNSCPGLTTGGHVFCLAPEVKIMMADGTEKPVLEVKAGDEVMAFDAKQSRGVLRKAKVKATAVTKEQKLVQINDLKITPLHKIVLSNGRAVMAKDIKVGDKILKASGLLMTVTKVEKNLPAVTVYNLALDGADGYIADGVRVLEYPIPDGLVK